MDYQELVVYLEANWPKTTLREPVRDYPFDRLLALLARLGSPEQHGEYVGVTGSKGKGSIGRLLAEVLRAHGLRVGVFSSPHLVRVEERVELDGSPLAPEVFANRFGLVLQQQRAAGLEDLGITPVLLGLALSYFRDEASDVAVLEVRAGGRFDPTNVAPARVVCVGPIELEHVPGLGYSLADIAWQKAGLLKPGAMCYSARQPPEAERVLEGECGALGVSLQRVGHELDYVVVDRSEIGQTVELRTPGGTINGLPLSMLGEHQAANAALAAGAAAAVLAHRGSSLDSAALASGLGRARLAGRLERLSQDRLVIYDGAHTTGSAAALARALADHFPGRRWSFVLGVLSGKDAAGMLERLSPLAARLRCVPVPGFSFQQPERLTQQGRALGLDCAERASLAEALDEVMSLPEAVCVTGTLYLYGAALDALRRSL
jgi:dihydrofolate synthase/folylpolyglutamate synthase